MIHEYHNTPLLKNGLNMNDQHSYTPNDSEINSAKLKDKSNNSILANNAKLNKTRESDRDRACNSAKIGVKYYNDYEIKPMEYEPHMELQNRGLSYEAYQQLLDKIRGLQTVSLPKQYN